MLEKEKYDDNEFVKELFVVIKVVVYDLRFYLLKVYLYGEWERFMKLI